MVIGGRAIRALLCMLENESDDYVQVKESIASWVLGFIKIWNAHRIGGT